MLAENLDVFFADFAQEAQIKIGTSPSVKILIIFDRQDSVLGLGAEGSIVTATGKASDMVGVAHYDLLTIDGKIFTVVGIDETNEITELQLKE